MTVSSVLQLSQLLHPNSAPFTLQKALHMNLRGFAFFSYLDHYSVHAVRTFLPLLSPTIDALLLNSATSASNVLHGVFFFLLTFFQSEA